MKKYEEKVIVKGAMSVLQRNADSAPPGIIKIYFKGYTVEDLECKYCLHYGGKSKGCLIAECCCEDEKQQTAQEAATNFLEVSL